MKTHSRIARWATGLAFAVIAAIGACFDLGTGLMAWAGAKAKEAGAWITAQVISIASAAPAKADQLNPAPAERLRSWREQYQARTLKRQTPTVTDRWRMCPSI